MNSYFLFKKDRFIIRLEIAEGKISELFRESCVPGLVEILVASSLSCSF